MTEGVEDYFNCPVCTGKMKFQKFDHNDYRPKCQTCGELFTAEWVRGFWAGYAKGSKDANT